MKQFDIQILAADHVFYEGACESLNVPTTHGLFGILANHSNLIAAIVPGRLSYRVPGGENLYAAVSEGLLKVENNKVLVLVDSAERPEEIDANRALREAEEAKEEMLQKNSIIENRLASANLARALNRLKVKNGSKIV